MFPFFTVTNTSLSLSTKTDALFWIFMGIFIFILFPILVKMTRSNIPSFLFFSKLFFIRTSFCSDRRFCKFGISLFASSPFTFPSSVFSPRKFTIWGMTCYTSLKSWLSGHIYTWKSFTSEKYIFSFLNAFQFLSSTFAFLKRFF